MNTKAACLVISLACCLLAAGCQGPTVIAIYNNTAEDIQVGTEWGWNKLQPHASVRFRNPYRTRRVLVIRGGVEYEYRVNPIPRTPDYINYKANPHYRLQLEDDGSVYVLKHDQPWQTKDFGTQPPGYPLTPLGKW